MLRPDRRQSDRRSVRFVPVALVVILFCIFSLLYRPVRELISQTIYAQASAVWKFGGVVGDTWNGFWGSFRSSGSFIKDNDTLKEEINRMQAEVLDRNLLSERVTKLEEMLGRKGEDNRVVAQVLSDVAHSPYDVLVIDAGSEQGVSVGDQVVYAGAGVIGEIVEVYNTSAKVKFFSSPERERAVQIGTRGIPGLARGRGMGNFETKVPQGSSVSVGDEVRLPGNALILGIVGAVDEKPAQPFVRVLFRTTFNIAEIRSVEVLVKKVK